MINIQLTHEDAVLLKAVVTDRLCQLAQEQSIARRINHIRNLIHLALHPAWPPRLDHIDEDEEQECNICEDFRHPCICIGEVL